MIGLLFALIVSVDSLWRFQNGAPAAAQEFAVTGTVVNVCRGLFVLECDKGATTICGVAEDRMPAIGDRVAVRGSVSVEFQSCAAPNVPRFESVRIEKLGRGNVPEPVRVSFAELKDGAFDLKRIRTRASVTEVLDDTADPDRVSLVLRSGGDFQTAVINRRQLERLDRLPGTEIEFTGMLLRQAFGGGTFMSTVLLIAPSDRINVVARATCWTPARLLVVFSILFAVFLVLLVRNHMRRRELGIKVGERTRFAVELHDSLSQNLEGLACQVAATKGLIRVDPSSAAAFLGTAERMLDSCRTELKRCLFDLRGDALEEKDLARAIERTLATSLGDIGAVTVDFAAAREELDDYVAHSVLCIVRELASNAVRHGKARSVKIRGAIRDGKVAFSVTDDGSGFDPANRPGPESGHFGLVGIADRVRHLGGEMRADSRPGGPTVFEIVLPCSQEENHG